MDRSREASSHASAAKRLVLLSGAFLVLQVASTNYGRGPGEPAVATGWLVIGAVLLWLVFRKHSRLTRGIIIVTSFAGAIIYALVAVEDARAGLLAMFYLGQALPLLAAPVRQHVQAAHSRS